jgi:predicted Kef-type K+ transport protein
MARRGGRPLLWVALSGIVLLSVVQGLEPDASANRPQGEESRPSTLPLPAQLEAAASEPPGEDIASSLVKKMSDIISTSRQELAKVNASSSTTTTSEEHKSPGSEELVDNDDVSSEANPDPPLAEGGNSTTVVTPKELPSADSRGSVAIVPAKEVDNVPPQEHAKINMTHSGSAEESSTHVLVLVPSRSGETCTLTCSRSRLVCRKRRTSAANTCQALTLAFTCARCVVNSTQVSPSYVAEHNTCVIREASAMDPSCDDSAEGVRRLCPCGHQTVLEVENARLRQELMAEAEERQSEFQKLMDLSAGVQALLKDYQSSKAALLAQEESKREQEDEDAAVARAQAILEASKEVDYESGMVTLPDGTKMDYHTAKSEAKQILSEAIRKAKQRMQARASPTASPSTSPMPSNVSSTPDPKAAAPSPQVTRPRPSAQGLPDPLPSPSPAVPSPSSSTKPPSSPHQDPETVIPETDGRKSAAEILLEATENELTSGSASGGRDPAILTYDTELLQDIASLLCAAALGGMLAALLKVPPSFGYLVGGALVGPSGFDLISHLEHVGTVAQFGVVFPLFANGLQFHLKDHARYHRQAIGSAAILSVVITLVFAVLGGVSLAVKAPWEGAMVGLAVSLCSPGVSIANLISTGQLTRTAGQLATGILAAQDLVMGFLLSLPSAIAPYLSKDHSGSQGVNAAAFAMGALIRSAAAFAAVVLLTVLLARRAVPFVVDFFASHGQQRDVHLLALVSLCMVLGVTTEAAGLSLEMGAFFAGLMVAGAKDIVRVMQAVDPLAQVFSGMFFASIGLVISPSYVWSKAPTILAILVFLFLLKASVLFGVVKYFGFSAKHSLVVAVTMAQVSEYSLIFTGKAHALGLLSRSTYLQWMTATIAAMVTSPLVSRALPAVLRACFGRTEVHEHGTATTHLADPTSSGDEAPLGKDVRLGPTSNDDSDQQLVARRGTVEGTLRPRAEPDMPRRHKPSSEGFPPADAPTPSVHRRGALLAAMNHSATLAPWTSQHPVKKLPQDDAAV